MRHLSTVRSVVVLLGLAAGLASVPVSADTIDFEGFTDSTIITNQYAGLTFTNAIILTAGISLNEFEFPPHSGVNVVSDNGGAMTITFATPITSFSGYFTYLEPLTLAGFDSSNTQIASARSAFSSNDALFGNPGSHANEFLQMSFLGGISSITITGDAIGGSFSMDDMSYSIEGVPEPGVLLLFLTAVGIVALSRRFHVTQ